MFGERLAELRKLNDDTQQILADKIGFSVWAVRAWEQEKNYKEVAKLVNLLHENCFHLG